MPASVWLLLHKSTLNQLHTFTSAVRADILYEGFRNNQIAPSKISLIITGSTPLSKKEFEEQFQVFSGSAIYAFPADTNGIYSLLDFDTQCKWSLNGVSNNSNTPQRTSTQAYLFSSEENKLHASYYPTTSDDEVFCNGEKVKGNLFTIKMELLKRYPF
jgi:hypothetical protein